MEFFCYHRDRPGSVTLREELLERHWSHMDRCQAEMIARGPTLAGGTPTGSVHILGLPDPAAARAFAFCPAGSLNDALRAHGPMSPARVREIGVKITDALAAAHAAGILHRDIKPANIQVNSYGMVGLSDFGLASIVAASGDQTASREALTPAYASPESFRGEEPTAAADLYSLTATLYALLAAARRASPPMAARPAPR